ncbi:Membrane associated serine protease, rhomboid family [Tranquillimonas rosea]|uniref:Membrane associated serine protease, rhomboid family n=1 Tax=Tranquillimonas rosea TaxID=641238 RepID=A0A1H9WXY5_9RHOB|nr:rhomboid family intramembrane serine protease [Tranquillimonas rosea]SES38537.1 Membrane associated serine protease, rhomboid family [Tranquillimonas rosea]
MFPIRDHNPSQRVPFVTYALILANVAVFLATLPLYSDPAELNAFFADWALVPAVSNPATFVTSQFLHGGIAHLAGNMLFLWIFGDNLEDELGHWTFLGFYLLGGIGAGIAQVLPDPSAQVPMVGASGAIAAVMGGYLLLFPRARVDILVILLIFFRIVPVPAWLVLGLWFGLQLISGAATPMDGGGVAYWAHAGGFLVGLLATIPHWRRKGGTDYWHRTHGHPPHPEAQYRLRRTTVPRAGRHRQ